MVFPRLRWLLTGNKVQPCLHTEYAGYRMTIASSARREARVQRPDIHYQGHHPQACRVRRTECHIPCNILRAEYAKAPVILDDLESNGLITSYEILIGKKKTVTMYRPTPKGIEFCNDILEVYEKMFPRGGGSADRKPPARI